MIDADSNQRQDSGTQGEPPSTDELWRTVQQQQRVLAEQASELARLRACLPARPERQTLEVDGCGDSDVPRRGVTRAGLLKSAAIGSASALAATVLGAPESALANGTLVTGGTNLQESTTYLSWDGAASASASMLYLEGNGKVKVGLHAESAAIAVWGDNGAGTSTTLSNIAVLGTNGSNGGQGIRGHDTASSGGTAVAGDSTYGDGVSGSSTFATGVSGASTYAVGVSGTGDTYGVLGTLNANLTASGGSAVKGVDPTASQGQAGVLGVSKLGTGVLGTAGNNGTTPVPPSGVGVYGETHDPAGVGVEGFDGTGAAYGVSGRTSGGVGVIGFNGSTTVGVRTDNNGVMGHNDVAAGNGVYGIDESNSTNGIGVEGTSSGGIGGFFQGGLSPLHLEPGATSTPPSATGQSIGNFYMGSTGTVYVFTSTGWHALATTLAATDARVSSLKAQTRAGQVDFFWRMADGAHGVLGFYLYAGGRRLNSKSIPRHASRAYHHRSAYRGSGPYSLGIVMLDGRELRVHAR